MLRTPQEMEEVLRAVPVAHPFPLQPCDPNMLRVAVERATSLSNILSNKLLVKPMGSVKDLPVLSRTYLALRRKLAEPEAPIRGVVNIVEQDVAISAKILQLANSAFFGLPREVSSMRTAMGFLGIDALQNLVLSAEYSPFSTGGRGCRVFLAKSFRSTHSSARRLPDNFLRRLTCEESP